MLKSLVVHYKNKYPGADVSAYDDGLDVFQGGEHKVAIRKSGAGQFVCVSEEMGCSDRHDLSPIPKDARVHKVDEKGRIALDEKSEERKKMRSDFIHGGKVLSCDELKAKGWEFDRDQRVIRKPKQDAEASA